MATCSRNNGPPRRCSSPRPTPRPRRKNSGSRTIRKAQTEIIAADQARRDNNRAKEGDAEANLRHARAEWEKARNEANAAATATKEAAISKRRPDFGMDLGSFSASGTFSSFGAWGLGTGGPVQEIAHHTQMTVEKLEALLRKAQSGGLVFE